MSFNFVHSMIKMLVFWAISTAELGLLVGSFYLVCVSKQAVKYWTPFRIRQEKLINIRRLSKFESPPPNYLICCGKLTLIKLKYTTPDGVGQVSLRLVYLYLIATDTTVNHEKIPPFPEIVTHCLNFRLYM